MQQDPQLFPYLRSTGMHQVGLIGPATVGGIKPGCMRIGNTGGMLDNIVMSKVRTKCKTIGGLYEGTRSSPTATLDRCCVKCTAYI